jgi:biotin carboxyl carrier protein
MIKLQAEINHGRHDLRLRREGELVSAEVDGRAYSLEVQNHVSGVFLLRSGTNIFHCRVEAGGKPDVLNVSLGGREYAIQLTDPKRLRGSQTSGAHDRGAVQIVASMPGKVVRLLVEVGSQVEAGAGIVVVEAMKMQNEMKSPKAGVVTSLSATAGTTVNAGDVLAEIE